MLMNFLFNISVCPFLCIPRWAELQVKTVHQNKWGKREPVSQKPVLLRRECIVNVPGKLAVHIVLVAQSPHFPSRRTVSLNHSNHTTVAAYLSHLAVHTVKHIAGQESAIHCVVAKGRSIWTLYLSLQVKWSCCSMLQANQEAHYWNTSGHTTMH